MPAGPRTQIWLQFWLLPNAPLPPPDWNWPLLGGTTRTTRKEFGFGFQGTGWGCFCFFNRSDMLRYVFRTHSSGCAENGLGGDQGQRQEEQSGVCEHKLEKRPLLMPTASDVAEAASSPTLPPHSPNAEWSAGWSPSICFPLQRP